jgi:hypothetical protein
MSAIHDAVLFLLKAEIGAQPSILAEAARHANIIAAEKAEEDKFDAYLAELKAVYNEPLESAAEIVAKAGISSLTPLSKEDSPEEPAEEPVVPQPEVDPIVEQLKTADVEEIASMDTKELLDHLVGPRVPQSEEVPADPEAK